MSPLDLRRWIQRHGLTRERAAGLLGLTRAQLDHRLYGGGRIEGPLARLIEVLDALEHPGNTSESRNRDNP